MSCPTGQLFERAFEYGDSKPRYRQNRQPAGRSESVQRGANGFSTIVTSSEPKFATTRSGAPSPFRSSTATE